MKSIIKINALVISFLMVLTAFSQKQNQNYKLNSAIDNQGYWRAAAELGLTAPNPQRSAPPAIYTGSKINALSVLTEDSPDVLIISGSTSQSENSVFVNPNDADNPLNSNNSTNQPSGGITLYGADYLYSFDAGETWGGSIQGAGGANSGDPTTAIGLNGRYYIGFINNSSGQSIAYSDNQGTSWSTALVANAPSGFGNMLDKNHMWIDNSSTSPYEGNLYNAWTAFGGSNDNDIEISRSTDDGLTWSTPVNISQVVNAGNHSQGVNIQTGPDGEVYAAFCIYDNWPSDEDAIGFSRSFDGGVTWESYRIINNIKGIRSSGTGKNMRVNAFPVMAVDISSGPNRGNIYVTWTNTGVPGINSGSDVDVYMIRSEDDGVTWSEPIRVNQDPAGQGKKHYFGWITCDPATGTLSMIFYDDRNVSGSQVQVFCANSTDAGDTWEDFQVSDVSFSPSPIPGLASQYFGDYLGITARNGKVYPVWTDNRTGTALTYCSPYVTSTMVAPTGLIAHLDEDNGAVSLTWSHQGGPTFDHYNIYRGFFQIGQTTFPLYFDTLPNYGFYRYQVTAVYTVEGESGPASADVQWGNAQAENTPESIEIFMTPDEMASVNMTLANVGELPLEYTSAFSLPENSRDTRDYCTGLGGCGEGISGVVYGTVSNFSQCDGYADYSDLSTLVTKGESFEITVYNSTNVYPEDVCGIWIDWDQDGNLNDDGTITVEGSPGPGPYAATITVPEDAKNGDARMRIRLKRGGTLSPCGSAPNGEVEDYSVNVLGWVSAAPREGEIEPGESLDITFDFNSEGFEVGSYMANFTIISNDPDNPELVVPVTMNVDLLSVTISADKDSLCYGGLTTLHANVVGGSGSFTYNWTSDPPGFSSTDPDPMVSPLVTTTYFVEVNDGSVILEDEIIITVISLPEPDLGEDISVCESGEATFDAGPGFATYLWSNGQFGGQSITVSEAGLYWVEVSNAFGCSNRDSAMFMINPLPDIDLGPDGAFCEGSVLSLSPGMGFASYLWSTGETDESIDIVEEGAYWVDVMDENGCTNTDTIYLALYPQPQVDLGDDQVFCEGTNVELTAPSGFSAYLWSTGETTSGISVGVPGEHWVEITDDNGCSNRDTVTLTMDPLPVAPEIISGPSTVDSYIGVDPPPTYTCTENLYTESYEWNLDPSGAGTLSAIGTSAYVNWTAGFTGIVNITVRGTNDCGNGNYSQAYQVSVYSSQAIGENESVSGIKLFPNPNDGVFVLQFNSVKEQEIRFLVTAAGGKQVVEYKEGVPAGPYQRNFNLGELTGGTYYLVILDNRGRMISRMQIVIK